ncbi:MAG: sodium-dependent bicarbonate transport family permease, partial [Gammaproteobacteria bacterium]
LFIDLFKGALALFLVEMGLIAASRLGDLRQLGLFLVAFGTLMPLAGALVGAVAGTLAGLSPGGVTMVAILGASASYIAVPAAMRIAVPEARHSLSITASLAITFPFNVLVGVPLYTDLVARWA